MAAIDIIIPVYNQAHLISGCIDSICKQTYRDFSIIVVDDGSTDRLADKLQPYATRVRYIRQSNQGAPAARNRGAKEGSGEYILFCDADVLLSKKFLERHTQNLHQHKTPAYSYSSFKYGFKTFRTYPFDAKRLRQTPYIHTTSLLRKKYFPGFDENLKRFQDWDLWLTLLDQGYTGVWVDEVLFTVQPGGTMSHWLPEFAFSVLPWLPSVRAYRAAAAIVKAKHQGKT